MNNVSLIGRLTKEPSVHKTNDNKVICNFTLAVDDTHSREDRADFISVVVFGNQANVAGKYLRKGFLCGVSGRLKTETWVDSQNVKRWATEVIADRVQFLQWPARAETASEEQQTSAGFEEVKEDDGFDF